MKNTIKLIWIIALAALTAFAFACLASCDDDETKEVIISVENKWGEEITVKIEQMNNEYNNYVIETLYTDVPIPAHSTKDFTFSNDRDHYSGYYYRINASSPTKSGRISVRTHLDAEGYKVKRYIVKFE